MALMATFHQAKYISWTPHQTDDLVFYIFLAPTLFYDNVKHPWHVPTLPERLAPRTLSTTFFFQLNSGLTWHQPWIGWKLPHSDLRGLYLLHISAARWWKLTFAFVGDHAKRLPQGLSSWLGRYQLLQQSLHVMNNSPHYITFKCYDIEPPSQNVVVTISDVDMLDKDLWSLHHRTSPWLLCDNLEHWMLPLSHVSCANLTSYTVSLKVISLWYEDLTCNCKIYNDQNGLV